MHIFIVIILASLLQFNKISCESKFGHVFPIPLTISYEDPNFRHCPIENGTFVHTTNCTLFHLCTSGIHRIYSCIKGFFFNPTNGRCQHLSIVKEVNCETIHQKMMDMNFDSFAESVKDYNFHGHQQLSISKCTQTGIYPDIFDCSLFHYCHQNNHHEVFKCPNRLIFDPKTSMCLPFQLTNCLYELSTRIKNETDINCYDYAPGTFLPVLNHIDEFIICENNNKSISMKCKSGFIYNALTTSCEKGPCLFDSMLCQNEGQCIDEPTIEKGFKCVCTNQFQGEYCEQVIYIIDTTEQIITKEIIEKSSDKLFQNSTVDETTHIPYVEKLDAFQKNNISNNLQQEKFLLGLNSKQQQDFEQIIEMVLSIILILVGLILFGSIIYSIITLIRLIFYSSTQTICTWKTFSQESIV